MPCELCGAAPGYECRTASDVQTMPHRVRAWAALEGEIAAATAGAPPSLSRAAQRKIDAVALAILGGEPGDAQELEDARAAAVDVLRALWRAEKQAQRHGAAPENRKPYEAPRLTRLGRLPSIELLVVPSKHRPGELSLRVDPAVQSWGPVFEAMNEAGFKAGDVVRLTVVRR